MITIAVANQKGGVGKTTTAINLATALAAAGKRILLLDLDSQGNASTSLGIALGERKITSYDLMIGEASLAEAVMPSKIPGLDLIAATIDLSGVEIELVEARDRLHRIKQALAGPHYSPEEQGDNPQARWDICLIDCPPSLGLLTMNGLTAADNLLVPMQCEFLAMEGLSQLIHTVERVKASINPNIKIMGVVLTMFDRRNNLSVQVVNDVREVLGPLVFKTIIPRNVRLSEAPSHGLPALIYDHKSLGSQAYINLAREIMPKLEELNNER